MEKNITKADALNKIRCIIKTIKHETARLGKNDEWLDLDYANHRTELNDILYSLRDVIYINTINRRAHRQKQINIYSIQDIINKFIEYKDPFCVCPIEEDVIDSIIYTLQQVNEYFENKSLLNANIEDSAHNNSTLKSLYASSVILNDVQKSTLFIDIKAINKANKYLNDIIAGTRMEPGVKPLSEYSRNLNATGDLLTLLNIKSRIKSVISEIDDIAKVIDDAQKSIKDYYGLESSEDNELSEDDELY